MRLRLKRKTFRKNEEARNSADVYRITGPDATRTKSWRVVNTRTNKSGERAYSELELLPVPDPNPNAAMRVKRPRTLGSNDDDGNLAAFAEVPKVTQAPPVGQLELQNRKDKKVQNEAAQLKVAAAGPKAVTAAKGKRTAKPSAKIAAAKETAQAREARRTIKGMSAAELNEALQEEGLSTKGARATRENRLITYVLGSPRKKKK